MDKSQCNQSPRYFFLKAQNRYIFPLFPLILFYLIRIRSYWFLFLVYFSTGVSPSASCTRDSVTGSITLWNRRKWRAAAVSGCSSAACKSPLLPASFSLSLSLSYISYIFFLVLDVWHATGERRSPGTWLDVIVARWWIAWNVAWR